MDPQRRPSWSPFFNAEYPVVGHSRPKLERMGHGYWVTRTPDIHKDEWHAFVASCPDLRLPNRIFGEMPDGFESRPNLPEFVWLNVGTPSKILFSKGAIFIDASGQEAAQFALAAAEYFGATAQEA